MIVISRSAALCEFSVIDGVSGVGLARGQGHRIGLGCVARRCVQKAYGTYLLTEMEVRRMKSRRAIVALLLLCVCIEVL